MKAKAKVTPIGSANAVWFFCWRVDAIHCTDSKVALRRDFSRLAEQNECLIEECNLVRIFIDKWIIDVTWNDDLVVAWLIQA